MEQKDLMVLFASSVAAYSAAQELRHGSAGWLAEYYVTGLDPLTYRDTMKEFKAGWAQIQSLMDDARAVGDFAGSSLNRMISERIAKSWVLREKCEWDIRFVNEAARDLDAFGMLAVDLVEMAATLPGLPDALTAPLEALAGAEEVCTAFRDGAFTAAMRALDESHSLYLKDKMVEVDDAQQNRDAELTIALRRQQAQGIGQGQAVTKSLDGGPLYGQGGQALRHASQSVRYASRSIIVPGRSQPPKGIDIAEARKFSHLASNRFDQVQVDKSSGREVEGGGMEYAFKSTFVAKHVDLFMGVATGIVMPAGSPERTYLADKDGYNDYFPPEVVQYCQYDWSMNSPKINRQHDAKDTYFFWEHPEWMVVENWICRARFPLGGDWVEPGDWVASTAARTEESRVALREGLFNGFSVEGWVVYFPGEYLT